MREEMEDEPLVTVITPSFNQAQFLRATLQSVADQRYPRIEHLILDGGSTDGSVEILRDWSAHPIRWRSEPDSGQAAAIQAGVNQASGQILSWLNSDDVYLTGDVISQVVDQFRRGARAVTAGGKWIDAAGGPFEDISVRGDALDVDSLSRIDYVLQPATFYETALARELPLDTSLRWAFDWDFFIRLAGRTRIVPMDVSVAGYRRHGTAKTVTGGPARDREILRVIRRHNRPSPRVAFYAGAIGARIVAGHLPARLGMALIYRVINPVAWWIDGRTGGIGVP
jgi:hypothetical protein